MPSLLHLLQLLLLLLLLLLLGRFALVILINQGRMSQSPMVLLLQLTHYFLHHRCIHRLAIFTNSRRRVDTLRRHDRCIGQLLAVDILLMLYLAGLMHYKSHTSHPRICLLLPIQTGRYLRVRHVLLGSLCHVHVSLRVVVVGSGVRADLWGLGLRRLLTWLQFLRLAAIDATVVGSVGDQSALAIAWLQTHGTLDVCKNARLNTCVSLVAGDTIWASRISNRHQWT